MHNTIAQSIKFVPGNFWMFLHIFAVSQAAKLSKLAKIEYAGFNQFAIYHKFIIAIASAIIINFVGIGKHFLNKLFIFHKL